MNELGLRIAEPWTALFFAARQQKGGRGVGGIVIERGVKVFGGGGKVALAPQRVTQIELVHRIAAIAFQSFAEIIHR